MSEALPITYDQYAVVELSDKLYNSVTLVFCSSRNFILIGCKRVRTQTRDALQRTDDRRPV